jgi:hypothetical protein
MQAHRSNYVRAPIHILTHPCDALCCAVGRSLCCCRYWNPRGKLIVGDDQANTRWSTWTSPLGFDVMGAAASRKKRPPPFLELPVCCLFCPEPVWVY